VELSVTRVKENSSFFIISPILVCNSVLVIRDHGL
jgi:hypothetical protein